jgi:N-acetylglucosamine-6-phosphate deacetylase
MATAVRNTVSLVGVSLEEAARMASTYPAEFLGLADSYGRIAPDYRADLVALDADLRVQATWVGGALHAP